MINSWQGNSVSLLHVELSSFCNAACPFCPRHVESSCKVRPELIQTSISLDQFKTWFPIDVIKGMRRILYCGTHGDPMMAKDALEIFEYVHSVNPGCWQMIHTNGGMRKPDWWFKLGKIINEENHNWMVFSIDGLKDTNHLYRRNVQWDNLMANAQAFIDGGGKAIWEYLVFEHNEHQIEEADSLSAEMGFAEFKVKRPLGFTDYEQGGLRYRGVYNKEGELEYHIAPATNERYVNKVQQTLNKRVPKFINVNIDKNIDEQVRNFKDLDLTADYLQELDPMEIKCKSHDQQFGLEVYVSSLGVVYPCCYVGTRMDSDIDLGEDLQLRKRVEEVGKEKLQLTTQSVDTIIQSGILDELYTQNWTQPSIRCGKMAYCAQICGTNSEIDRIYESRRKVNQDENEAGRVRR